MLKLEKDFTKLGYEVWGVIPDKQPKYICFPLNVILNFIVGFSGREIKLQADFEHPDIIFILFADHDLSLWRPQGAGGAGFSSVVPQWLFWLP